jgi:hypothetical protein
MDGRRHGIQLLNQQSCHPVQAMAADDTGSRQNIELKKRRLPDRSGADALTPIAIARSKFNEREQR